MTSIPVPPWVSLLHSSLVSHLNSFADPELEILPHPRPESERGACGAHGAFRTSGRHFCLFLCCAKTLVEACSRELRNERSEEGWCGGRKRSADEDIEGRRKGVKKSDCEDVDFVSTLTPFPADDLQDFPNCKKVINAVENDLIKKPLYDPTSVSFRRESLARLCLIVNSEDYGAWNELKRTQDSPAAADDDEQLRFEFKFAHFLLTRHPRSAETFVHLRFLQRRAVEAAKSAEGVLTIVDEGLRRCSSAASRYHGNYHAWDHRRWLVRLALKSGTKAEAVTKEETPGEADAADSEAAAESTPERIAALFRREMEEAKSWQRSHVSDACPFSYRIFLLRILSSSPSSSTLSSSSIFSSPSSSSYIPHSLLDDLLHLDNLMLLFPGHESLWSHRRELRRLAVESASAPDLRAFEDADRSFLLALGGEGGGEWETTLRDRYEVFTRNLTRQTKENKIHMI